MTALRQADRATHERNPQAVSAVSVGIPCADERDLWALLNLLADMQGKAIPVSDLDEIKWRVERLQGAVQ